MMMNDPIGDMLTRIRNSQMRGKSTVKTPASKLRAWVLDVLVSEGYIRGYESALSDNGQGELTISLKYFEGTPVIRELKRVSKLDQGSFVGSERPWYRNPVHPQGCDDGCKCTRCQCWRRSALHRILRGGVECLVSAKNLFPCSRALPLRSPARPLK
jgi:small subunit ribosomal protein S8